MEVERPQFVGTQLYGWGQYYERQGKPIAEHMDEVLSAVRDGGFDFAEGFLDANHHEANAAFADRLKAKGLRPVSMYSGGALHDPRSADETIEKIVAAGKAAQASGFMMFNVNPDPVGRAKTEAELLAQSAALDRLGKGLNEVGIVLGIHNHTWEMLESAREFHHDLRQTDPRHVGFCFDVHWVYRGKVAPMDALREYHARVVSWHLRQSRGGVWWEELDEGDVDFPELAAFVQEHACDGPYIVELAIEEGTKITREWAENNKRSRDFVKRVFGA